MFRFLCINFFLMGILSQANAGSLAHNEAQIKIAVQSALTKHFPSETVALIDVDQPHNWAYRSANPVVEKLSQGTLRLMFNIRFHNGSGTHDCLSEIMFDEQNCIPQVEVFSCDRPSVFPFSSSVEDRKDIWKEEIKYCI